MLKQSICKHALFPLVGNTNTHKWWTAFWKKGDPEQMGSVVISALYVEMSVGCIFCNCKTWKHGIQIIYISD